MTNKLKKIILFVLTLFLVLSMSVMTYANDAFLQPSIISASDESNTATTVSKIAGSVLSVVQVIGVSIAVIMLIVLAIKYISSAPNDKAEIKKNAITYVVGAVVLFGATGLLQIIKNFAGNIKS